MLISSLKDRRLVSVVFAAAFLISGCAQLKSPEPEPYFSKTQPPAKQELRWTNGKLPKTFDPALAAAAPDIDIARAIFDGLTDLDPVTLDAIPAIAEKWESDEEHKSWTFHLRADAKWSNGEKITAADFVRSWNRLVEMGNKVPHRNLLLNIDGLGQNVLKKAQPTSETEMLTGNPEGRIAPATTNAETPEPITSPVPNSEPTPTATIEPPMENKHPGFAAVSETELKVTLLQPDKEFPKLVAHPIFRPVQSISDKTGPQIVTSGPFKIASNGSDGVLLDRVASYWDSDAVKLERVKFVPSQTAERALESYRNGEVDVVTNSEFSSAALKLLEPYEDFRRTSFAAINFYELNTTKAPFNDRRVREALAIAIERENFTEGELGGSTRAATSFTPFATLPGTKLIQDKERAKQLLEDAGFPEGEGFPIIRLLINRNDTQQRIARSVARMWKQTLNIEVEIIVKDAVEFAAAKDAGDFDAIRRGVVIATPDETATFLSMFYGKGVERESENFPTQTPRSEFSQVTGSPTPNVAGREDKSDEGNLPSGLILTEEAAMYEFPGIPLYSPTSYSLVKPYIKGFDANSLDAPLLKRVEIDNNWTTK